MFLNKISCAHNALPAIKCFFLATMMVTASSCSSLSMKELGLGKSTSWQYESAAVDKAQVTEAENAFDTQDYRKAAALYETISTQVPEHAEYKLKHADSLRLAGDNIKARAAYDALLSVVPPNTSYAFAALEGKGLAYMQEANFNNASKLFIEVLGKDATRWKTINALGVSLSLGKRYKEAMDYYTMALQTSNNHPTVLNNMGLSYALSGNLKKAAATLEKALKGPPAEQNRKRISLNLALVYGLGGHMKEAEEISKPYLTKPAIYNNLGYYATLAKNKSQARKFLEKALAASPNHYQKAWDNMQKVK